jgi:hypothetical protein
MPYQWTKVSAVLSALPHYHNTYLFIIFLSPIGIVLANFPPRPALAKWRLREYICWCTTQVLQDLKACWYGREWTQNYLCQ